MAQTNSRFFSVMVVGDNHKELIDKYNIDLEVEPYIKYEYLKADKYLSNAIKSVDGILKNADKIGIEPQTVESLKTRAKVLRKMTPFEYYRGLTEGMYYDNDGNALGTENLDGHWKTARIARNFATPLKLKNGEEVYSARACDVDWDSMHNSQKELYKSAWEVAVEGREPTNDTEKQILESMGDKQVYFSNFKDKDDYVTYSSSYWNYAYVDANGWFDVDTTMNGDERKWIKTFFKNYVSKLNPNDLVTIYECSVNNG